MNHDSASLSGLGTCPLLEWACSPPRPQTGAPLPSSRCQRISLSPGPQGPELARAWCSPGVRGPHLHGERGEPSSIQDKSPVSLPVIPAPGLSHPQIPAHLRPRRSQRTLAAPTSLPRFLPHLSSSVSVTRLAKMGPSASEVDSGWVGTWVWRVTDSLLDQTLARLL